MNSLVDWLRANFDGQTSGDEYVIDCPFCGDSGHHMYINISKGIFHCFKCEKKGTTFSFIKEYLGAESYAEVWAQIKEPKADVSEFRAIVSQLAGRKATTYTQEKSEGMPDWYEPFSAMTAMDKHAKIVLRYTLTRMSWDNIVKYGIGACWDPDDEKFRWRMIVPIEHD